MLQLKLSSYPQRQQEILELNVKGVFENEFYELWNH